MHEFKEPKEQNLEKKYISIIEQIRSLISNEEDIVGVVNIGVKSADEDALIELFNLNCKLDPDNNLISQSV